MKDPQLIEINAFIKLLTETEDPLERYMAVYQWIKEPNNAIDAENLLNRIIPLLTKRATHKAIILSYWLRNPANKIDLPILVNSVLNFDRNKDSVDPSEKIDLVSDWLANPSNEEDALKVYNALIKELMIPPNQKALPTEEKDPNVQVIIQYCSNDSTKAELLCAWLCAPSNDVDFDILTKMVSLLAQDRKTSSALTWIRKKKGNEAVERLYMAFSLFPEQQDRESLASEFLTQSEPSYDADNLSKMLGELKDEKLIEKTVSRWMDKQEKISVGSMKRFINLIKSEYQKENRLEKWLKTCDMLIDSEELLTMINEIELSYRRKEIILRWLENPYQHPDSESLLKIVSHIKDDQHKADVIKTWMNRLLDNIDVKVLLRFLAHFDQGNASCKMGVVELWVTKSPLNISFDDLIKVVSSVGDINENIIVNSWIEKYQGVLNPLEIKSLMQLSGTIFSNQLNMLEQCMKRGFVNSEGVVSILQDTENTFEQHMIVNAWVSNMKSIVPVQDMVSIVSCMSDDIDKYDIIKTWLSKGENHVDLDALKNLCSVFNEVNSKIDLIQTWMGSVSKKMDQELFIDVLLFFKNELKPNDRNRLIEKWLMATEDLLSVESFLKIISINDASSISLGAFETAIAWIEAQGSNLSLDELKKLIVAINGAENDRYASKLVDSWLKFESNNMTEESLCDIIKLITNKNLIDSTAISTLSMVVRWVGKQNNRHQSLLAILPHFGVVSQKILIVSYIDTFKEKITANEISELYISQNKDDRVYIIDHWLETQTKKAKALVDIHLSLNSSKILEEYSDKIIQQIDINDMLMLLDNFDNEHAKYNLIITFLDKSYDTVDTKALLDILKHFETGYDSSRIVKKWMNLSDMKMDEHKFIEIVSLFCRFISSRDLINVWIRHPKNPINANTFLKILGFLNDDISRSFSINAWLEIPKNKMDAKTFAQQALTTMQERRYYVADIIGAWVRGNANEMNLMELIESLSVFEGFNHKECVIMNWLEMNEFGVKADELIKLLSVISSNVESSYTCSRAISLWMDKQQQALSTVEIVKLLSFFGGDSTGEYIRLDLFLKWIEQRKTHQLPLLDPQSLFQTISTFHDDFQKIHILDKLMPSMKEKFDLEEIMTVLSAIGRSSYNLKVLLDFITVDKSTIGTDQLNMMLSLLDNDNDKMEIIVKWLGHSGAAIDFRTKCTDVGAFKLNESTYGKDFKNEVLNLFIKEEKNALDFEDLKFSTFLISDDSFKIKAFMEWLMRKNTHASAFEVLEFFESMKYKGDNHLYRLTECWINYSTNKPTRDELFKVFSRFQGENSLGTLFLLWANSLITQTSLMELTSDQKVIAQSFGDFKKRFERVNGQVANQDQHGRDFDHMMRYNAKKLYFIYTLCGADAFVLLSRFIVTSALELERQLGGIIVTPLALNPLKILFEKNRDEIVSNKMHLNFIAIMQMFALGIDLIKADLDQDCTQEDIEKSIRFIELKAIIDNSVDLRTCERDACEFVMTDFLSSLGVQPRNVDFKLVLERIPVSLFSQLLSARKVMNRGKSSHFQHPYLSIFDAFLVADITGASFENCLGHNDFRQLQDHNTNIRNKLSNAKIDSDLAMSYNKKSVFEYGGSVGDVDTHQLILSIWHQLAKLRKCQSEHEGSNKKLNKLLDDFQKPLLKGFQSENQASLDNNQSKDIFTKLFKVSVSQGKSRIDTLIQEIKKIKLDSSANEFITNIENAASIFNNLLKMQNSQCELPKLSKKKKFIIQMLDKSLPDVFELGRHVGCCLAPDGGQFPAMVERRMDDAMFIPVVIDEETHRPISLAWLYYGHPPGNENEVYVVANFFEIAASYGCAEKIRDVIVHELQEYIAEFADSIGAKGFLMNNLSYGLIPDFKGYKQLPTKMVKLGGYLTLNGHSTQYYLNSLTTESFNVYQSKSLKIDNTEDLQQTHVLRNKSSMK